MIAVIPRRLSAVNVAARTSDGVAREREREGEKGRERDGERGGEKEREGERRRRRKKREEEKKKKVERANVLHTFFLRCASQRVPAK